MNRRISTTLNRYVVPQSFVTKGKQRLKQHIDTVYLNNGDEFEIELYNPTQNKVLTKIEMNGNSIGSGIILRPGERVFLERYLDEAKKFLFETYVVNGNNQEVQDAIAKNGDVVVKFYDEYIEPYYNTYSTNILTTTLLDKPYVFTSNGGVFTTNNMAGSFHNTTTSYLNVNNIITDPGINYNHETTKKRSLKETGRVEKGSESDQKFTYDNASFKNYPSTSNWWKIKPISERILVKEDLKVFCTECGSKRKKDSHKFCPNCGTKF
jgi:hypothetical protein